ncbi:MAG TPA: sorbosone dehydrogenase family protein [Vicinamibacterales bacterium]|nr:sorbosone dehydrogenase family protein [Vicinamibacterales bacterium]
MWREHPYLRRAALALIGFLAGLWLMGCGASAQYTLTEGVGAAPALPPPDSSLIPVINVVSAKGWANGRTPAPVVGTNVNAFARDLDHPRWLYVLPNGDVLVAETNAPVRPDDNTSIRGRFVKHYQQKAGGAVPSANRITLLRDADGDGVAEVRTPFITNLNSPFGMALVGTTLYVADTDAILRFTYREGETTITDAGVKVVDLPAGPRNHHWTKNVVAAPDGSKLYVAIGSNSNVAENGIDEERDRAMIWEVDPRTGAHRVFASGLRNPVGMAWEHGALWVAVNERDELGSDLVPDYMTAVRDGAFYGWPYSYWGAHVDTRVTPQRPDLVEAAIAPDYALGPHTASLGLASASGNSLGDTFREGMFVGQHGSWNRKPRSGYKVIFVPFANGRPSGKPIDVLTGFVEDNGDAHGRPVGVAVDRRGALLVADDVGNTVWRVAAIVAPSR